MDKKPNEIQVAKFDPHKDLQPCSSYSIKSYTTINSPYNWPAFLAASCLNIGYVFI